MDRYYSAGWKPIHKYHENTTLSAVVWTPATSARVVVSDILVTNGADGAGTFRVYFGSLGGIMVASVLGASASVSFSPKTPFESPQYDESVYFDSSVSHSSGGWSVTLSGFEIQ